MTKIICKGTKFQIAVADVLTDIAQVISIELPEAQSETFESDTLDNELAGIPYDPTGRTEGGSASMELFLDPTLSSHQTITGLLVEPELTDCAIVFADLGATTWGFVGAGFSLGGTVALKDGLKGKAAVKLSRIPDYPT